MDCSSWQRPTGVVSFIVVGAVSSEPPFDALKAAQFDALSDVSGYRWFFFLSLCFMLVVLLLPGPAVEAIKDWVLEWWPWRGSGMDSGAVSADKLLHALLFGLCGWALVRGWMSSARRWLVFYVPVLAFAALTEVVQHFVPGRGADPLDLLADGVGAAVGMIVALVQIRRNRRAVDVGRRAL